MATRITISSKENQMKTAAVDRTPGSTPDHVRRRMSQLYADFFSDVGEAVYAKAMAEMKTTLETVLNEGIKDLRSKIKDELGRQGFEAAIKHVRPWLDALVTDIRSEGFSSDDWAKQLDSMASQFSVEADEVPQPEGGDEELEGVKPPEQEAPAAEETVEEVKEEETEPVSESELQKILDQGAGAPPKEEPAAEVPKAAARTLGDLKREFAQRRRQHKVEGATEEIVSQSNALIDLLEG